MSKETLEICLKAADPLHHCQQDRQSGGWECLQTIDVLACNWCGEDIDDDQERETWGSEDFHSPGCWQAMTEAQLLADADYIVSTLGR